MANNSNLGSEDVFVEIRDLLRSIDSKLGSEQE